MSKRPIPKTAGGWRVCCGTDWYKGALFRLDIRELRDLTRRRRTLVGNGTAERNRVQKVLEDANVKIGNVLSDVFGISGQAMLEALLENKQSAAEIASLAHWSLAPKIPQIIEALEGHRMTDHHRLLIRQSLRHMRYIEEMIEELDKEIAVRLKPISSN